MHSPGNERLTGNFVDEEISEAKAHPLCGDLFDINEPGLSWRLTGGIV